jgi:hypothetical protein
LNLPARSVPFPSAVLSRSSTAFVVCDGVGERRCLRALVCLALRGLGGCETWRLLSGLGVLGVGGIGERERHRLDR